LRFAQGRYFHLSNISTEIFFKIGKTYQDSLRYLAATMIHQVDFVPIEAAAASIEQRDLAVAAAGGFDSVQGH